MKDIELTRWPGKWNYSGMVNKDDQPHGWGRAIRKDNYGFIDGQWQEGVDHGFRRVID